MSPPEPGLGEVSQWYQYCSLVGIEGNRLPLSDGLAGREICATDSDGDVLRLVFTDAETVQWSAGERTAADAYQAVEVDSDLYVVDFQPGGERGRDVFLVLDLASGSAISVSSVLVGDVAPRIETDVRPLSLSGGEPLPLRPSTALTGKRVLYHYSDENAIEHIYLTSALFTWHALSGVESGHADTEPTRTFEVRPNLYLFAWTEQRKAHDGAVLVDTNQWRSTGRLFGWDEESERVMHTTVGATAVLLNETVYP